MPITTDAKTPEDKRLAKAMIVRLAGLLADTPVEVKFLKTKVKIETEDSMTDMSRAQFNAWAEAEFPWRDTGPKIPNGETDDDNFRPQPKKASAKKKAAPKKAPPKKAPPKAKAAPPKAEPAPPPKPKKAEPKAADPSDVIEDLAHEAFAIEEDERAGQYGRNAARFKRGELMLRLQSVSQAAKVPAKKLLTMLNERTLAAASENGIPNFSIITESEATTVRRVVSAFGSSGEFRHLAGVDPATGKPMTGDDGKPIVLPLTEVAINKLYPLVEYADDVDQDTLLSFAHAATEKIVKKVKSVSKRTDRPIDKVIGDVLKMRVKKMSPLGEAVGEIEAPADESTVLASLREMAGEAPEPDVASLKTSRSWYEGTWLPIKGFVDSVAQAFMPDRVNDVTGQTSNVYILERILTAFYHPKDEDGVQRILGAMVEAEDITEEQANIFLNEFVAVEGSDEWVRGDAALTPEPEAVEPEVEDDDFDEDDLDDDDFDDDDFDLDTPPAPREEEEDEDDDDDDDDF